MHRCAARHAPLRGAPCVRALRALHAPCTASRCAMRRCAARRRQEGDALSLFGFSLFGFSLFGFSLFDFSLFDFSLFGLRYMPLAMKPPSTAIVWPVMKEAPAAQRKAVVAATSMGSPMRPRGVRVMTALK